MSDVPRIVRLPTLKSVGAFRQHLASLHLDLPCDETILSGAESPLTQPVADLQVNGRGLFNRWAVHPMEGWDGTTDGGVTDEVRRRWRRFGESGAALVWGGEAMAVVPEGRANPRQLMISPAHTAGLAELVSIVRQAHRERHGDRQEPVIGFQLTHSGRFCRPTDPQRGEPRVACRHPLLDRRFGVVDDRQLMSDDEVRRLIPRYVTAARVAREAGADFVDLKHCHGYLLHEFLGAHLRPGAYGGSFENRTRILRETVAAIRADGNSIALGVRLSAFDSVPFRPDPARSAPGQPGPGIPEDYSSCLPYWYGFGVKVERPLEADLEEPAKFLDLCGRLGVRLVNLSAGSPYYNPHLQRPALYPPSDGYQPPEDPLAGVVRQIQAVRILRRRAPPDLVLVGTGYTYLQEFLPHVAQAVVRAGWVDVIGLGRIVLSYPQVLADAVRTGRLEAKRLCRTFSDCTTAPRNGLVSGCYPLDDFYARRPEAQRLRAIKKDSPGCAPA